ncbi:hypothetical protein QYF36_007224 [Acer negundo]|nr:hypothetical protein QYF36_007224 [Acer negundo]
MLWLRFGIWGFGQWFVRHHHHLEKGWGLVGHLGGLGLPDCTRVLATKSVMEVELEVGNCLVFQLQAYYWPNHLQEKHNFAEMSLPDEMNI